MIENQVEKAQSKIELADIFRIFNVGRLLTGPESKVANCIRNCQTAVLGGHKCQCESCRAEHIVYNSCGNRHCPKCQFLARARWVKARIEELLPVQYFHLVFTIPAVLRLVFLQNKRICFNFLFKASQETLKAVAETKLKAKVGGVSVLHTWTQKLEFHPHIHMIVPGGGLSLDGTKWVSAKQDYFLPVKALSKVFRGKLLNLLETNYSKLEFKGELENIKSESDFKMLLISTTGNDWVVYCKKPFAGPEQVIKYLGNYTHRIAISNNRIKKVENGNVVFSYRDGKDDNIIKEMKLPGEEFIRRFLNHILPTRYNKIRYFGFLGRRSKKADLALCRKLLNVEALLEKSATSWLEVFNETLGFDPTICQKCKTGKLKIIEVYLSKLNPKKPRDTS